MTTPNLFSTAFNMTRDINGFNGFGVPFAFDNFTATLSANTAESVTVPSDNRYSKWIMICAYQPGTDVWVANNQTAAVPAGSSFAASTSQLNPIGRYVQAGDVISFITANDTSDVQVSFYGIK